MSWAFASDRFWSLPWVAPSFPIATSLLIPVKQHMAALRPDPGRLLTFNLAAGLTFLELVQCDGEMKQLTDVKALMDMQAIIQAQQAAACAAATSAAVAASTASH